MNRTIKMPEFIYGIIAVLVGLLLGAIFFGGLWWTVRKLQTTRHPALLFLGSLIVRMAVVLLGIYAIGAGHWERMVAALVGIVIGRFIILRVTHSLDAAAVPPSTPDSHAH